jgi:protein-disulfide isomerase
VLFPLFRRSAIIVVLFALGCRAQSPAPSPELSRRIENVLRQKFDLPPSVNITLGERKASEITGYDQLPVTLQSGSRSQTYEFLISKDEKTLAQLTKIDLGKDPLSVIDVKGRPVRGNPDAKITIINYDDFQCPFCAQFHKTLVTQIMPEYGNNLKVIYKDYPLFKIHPWAIHAAVDANCLNAQNSAAYWNYADYVHANARDISAKSPLSEQFKLLDAAARDQAQKSGGDAGKLDACLKANDEAAVYAQVKEGDSLGIDSTPTMFINGERVSGALPLEYFHTILDRAMRNAGLEPPKHPEVAKPAATAAPNAAPKSDGPKANEAKK